MDLNEVLSDKEPEQTEAPPTEEVKIERPVSVKRAHRDKEQAAQGRERDPSTGQYVPKKEVPAEEVKPEPKVEAKVEAKPEPKKEEFTEKERAFLRGLEEERRKRQELERQLNEIRSAKQQPAGEKKTFWDDPEGSLKQFEQTLEQKITQREINSRLQTSEAIARSRYKDFDEKVEFFAQMMGEAPGLHAQMMSAADPGEFVYRTAANALLLKQAGSLDDLKASIEKETRAKLEAEFKKKEQELEKKREALTGSVSEVKGASTRQTPVYNGPTPLGEILGR